MYFSTVALTVHRVQAKVTDLLLLVVGLVYISCTMITTIPADQLTLVMAVVLIRLGMGLHSSKSCRA